MISVCVNFWRNLWVNSLLRPTPFPLRGVHMFSQVWSPRLVANGFIMPGGHLIRRPLIAFSFNASLVGEFCLEHCAEEPEWSWFSEWSCCSEYAPVGGGGLVIRIVGSIVVGIRIIIWLSWADRLKARQLNTSTQEPEWDLTQGQVNQKLRSLSLHLP